MNAYGVTIALPWWLAVLTLSIAIALSVWAYGRPLPMLSPRQRLLLGILRGLALSLLVFALWQPAVSLVTSRSTEPRVAVLLDNSASMRLRDPAGPREAAYRRTLQQLQSLLTSPTAVLARFDATVQPLEQWHPDSLPLNGPATDIARALRWVASEAQHSHIQAVLLLSDGVVTAGEIPIPDAEALGKPIVTVLIGDTTPVRDLAVQSLLVNEQIPLGSQTPVIASISATAVGDQSVRVELWEDARRIAEQSVSVRADQPSYTVQFTYQPVHEGIHRLRVRVVPLPDEVSKRNNESAAFVEVVRIRRRVLIFAGSPSPDFAFLRRELQRNPLLELSTFVHKDATSFYEGTLSPSLVQQADAIVLVDFPLRSTPDAVMRMIAEHAARGRPLIWIAGPQTDRAKLQLLEPLLPVTVNVAGAPREHEATLTLTPSAEPYGLFRLPAGSPESWHQLPPVFAFSELARPKPTAEVLATASWGSVQSPLVVAQRSPSPSIAVLGYGLYRWKLMGYAAEQARGRTPAVDHYAVFVANIAQWLAQTERDQLVRIRTTKRFYATGEPVEFWASVVDPTGSPVEEALVRIRLATHDGSRELTLQPAGAGMYRGTLAGLPTGDYAFSGEALLNGKRLGSDRGRFSVGDVGLEERSLRADVELLRTLAQRTGGRLFPADSAEQAWEFIQHLPNFRPVVATTRRDLALWHSPWLLVLALGCFAGEWVLRRRWGLL